MAKPEKKRHDDSWLDNVQDVISTPTHRIKLFVDVRDNSKITVKIEYDNLKAIETILDEYDDNTKPKAFYESLLAFIREIPSNIKLQVEQTNVFYLFNEAMTEDRYNAKRTRELLNERNIKLLLPANPPSKKNRRGGRR